MPERCAPESLASNWRENSEFLSWDEVNPTPEERNESEDLFIRAIQSGSIVRELSDIPFQDSIHVYVYMEAVKHGIVNDISQISKC